MPNAIRILTTAKCSEATVSKSSNEDRPPRQARTFPFPRALTCVPAFQPCSDCCYLLEPYLLVFPKHDCGGGGPANVVPPSARCCSALDPARRRMQTLKIAS
ncbi:hypothetical protein B0T14DRAFT_508467 [Immersiella caudata]|uniref:Uncharacterized protein n=1 Tax=Immersiella caudata TaxID=314043 RepID=A0AA40CDF8_9PEZI|nr:hypothetical protein B0T14DRAFT_508467 [Immersiella caudata]